MKRVKAGLKYGFLFYHKEKKDAMTIKPRENVVGRNSNCLQGITDMVVPYFLIVYRGSDSKDMKIIPMKLNPVYVDIAKFCIK